jgi:hypothetical protein
VGLLIKPKLAFSLSKKIKPSRGRTGVKYHFCVVSRNTVRHTPLTPPISNHDTSLPRHCVVLFFMMPMSHLLIDLHNDKRHH